MFGFVCINVAQTETELNRIASLMWKRDASIAGPTYGTSVHVVLRDWGCPCFILF